MRDYSLHGFVVFVLVAQSDAFVPVHLQKKIARFSMGVNLLTLNKYMIKLRIP